MKVFSYFHIQEFLWHLGSSFLGLYRANPMSKKIEADWYMLHMTPKNALSAYKSLLIILYIIFVLQNNTQYTGKECSWIRTFKKYNFVIYEGLAYNRRDSRDRRSLSREPNRSWCHLHTSMKLSWSQPMASWIGGCIRVCCRPVQGSIGCDQESFTIVWRWHQLLFGPLPNGRLSLVSSRL